MVRNRYEIRKTEIVSSPRSPDIDELQHALNLGLVWRENPEQHRLRQELPLIAELLDACEQMLPPGIRVKQVDKTQRRLREKAERLARQQELKRKRIAAMRRAEAKRRRDETGRYVRKTVEG
jgi:hypothetical protein